MVFGCFQCGLRLLVVDLLGVIVDCPCAEFHEWLSDLIANSLLMSLGGVMAR